VTTVIVIAKETIPGRVKTRLNPPLSSEQAAELAAASLADTLDVVTALPASRRILLFDGNLLPLGSESFEVIHQVSGDLDMRLGAIFDECTGPTVLVGMDTPQLTAAHLAPVFDSWPADIDAWLGLANDGGYWAIAMREPDGSLIRGVPMSLDDTGAWQLASLETAGLRVGFLDELVDVDTIVDARAVAAIAPDGRFGQTLASFEGASL
jgi:glycosyltransferase A (GT-A) superfamily protein (DUF2064 family)